MLRHKHIIFEFPGRVIKTNDVSSSIHDKKRKLQQGDEAKSETPSLHRPHARKTSIHENLRGATLLEVKNPTR